MARLTHQRKSEINRELDKSRNPKKSMKYKGELTGSLSTSPLDGPSTLAPSAGTHPLNTLYHGDRTGRQSTSSTTYKSDHQDDTTNTERHVSPPPIDTSPLYLSEVSGNHSRSSYTTESITEVKSQESTNLEGSKRGSSFSNESSIPGSTADKANLEGESILDSGTISGDTYSQKVKRELSADSLRYPPSENSPETTRGINSLGRDSLLRGVDGFGCTGTRLRRKKENDLSDKIVNNRVSDDMSGYRMTSDLSREIKMRNISHSNIFNDDCESTTVVNKKRNRTRNGDKIWEMTALKLTGLRADTTEKDLELIANTCNLYINNIKLDRNIITHSCKGTGTLSFRQPNDTNTLDKFTAILKQHGFNYSY